jgi:hypothetical protein
MRNIIYEQAHLITLWHQEKFNSHIQAHLLVMIKTICNLLRYQGTLPFQDSLDVLSYMKDAVLEVSEF